jgi:hypothetical protein
MIFLRDVVFVAGQKSKCSCQAERSRSMGYHKLTKKNIFK